MFQLPISCAHCCAPFSTTISQLTAEVVCPHCQKSSPFPGGLPNESQWVVSRGKQQFGPFVKSQLIELAGSQQLQSDDKILRQGTSRWQKACSIHGVFPAVNDEETPKLVADSTKVYVSEDIFSSGSTPTPQGPLSMKGIKIRLNFTLTLGDFQIFRKLGAGGMGAVYLAQRRSTDHLVALKVLSDTLVGKEAFVNRFLREVTILASLKHPSIVNFFGAGQEKGVPFFAMEFIEGVNTATLVKRQGKLAVGDALFIVRQAAEAMSYALTQKIVHRDLKPENIMLTRGGKVKITDLGLAKPLEDADLDLTDTGTVLGSPKYMAPEQSRNPKLADHRSDIYALGGVLYFMVTGDEPFKGSSATELLLAKEQKIYPPARRLNNEVPARMDLLIDKMLAKEPKHRYLSYADLIRDLDGLGLAQAKLGIDPSLWMPISQTGPSADLVEILLIDDDIENVHLAQQALDENGIASNLAVVRDGAEARAYLRREGKFLVAPPPSLIIFGGDLILADSLLTLEEIKVNNELSQIPLVLLDKSSEAARFFESHGYRVRLLADTSDDPNQFNELFSTVEGGCLTVMEIKRTD